MTLPFRTVIATRSCGFCSFLPVAFSVGPWGMARVPVVPGATWLAEHAKDAVFVLRANSIVAAMNATIVGMGIGILPCFLADGEPSLRRLTPLAIGTRDILLVVHPDLAKVARVRAVMDYVVEVLTRDARMWDGMGGA
jgi:DNA-binding transcriptional LysR family regulator